MSVPKLNFRTKQLKIPINLAFKKQKIQIQVVQPTDVPDPPRRLERHCVDKHYISFVILFIFCLGVASIYRSATFKTVHTVKKLRCSVHNNVASCEGGARTGGTFVVEVSESCVSAVYEIGGFPFSAAKQNQPTIFKVPARDFTVKKLVSTCRINAYIDSAVVPFRMPFTWVTTAQHTRFTLKSETNTIAYDVSSSLFESETNGRWIAYTFDIPEDLNSVSVSGDGTDIIHTYGVFRTL